MNRRVKRSPWVLLLVLVAMFAVGCVGGVAEKTP